ncbi:unnamed protein product [Effrenium voratum]|uniref:NAD(P)(+)--arginine ADP-ribosyltransferase n=1 Tax=Effrenium voratum TaxID=2562239 RepID=A0AA36ICI3_9DINO|nr:unnamed protein product [Effrenium voratum]
MGRNSNVYFATADAALEARRNLPEELQGEAMLDLGESHILMCHDVPATEDNNQVGMKVCGAHWHEVDSVRSAKGDADFQKTVIITFDPMSSTAARIVLERPFLELECRDDECLQQFLTAMALRRWLDIEETLAKLSELRDTSDTDAGEERSETASVTGQSTASTATPAEARGHLDAIIGSFLQKKSRKKTRLCTHNAAGLCVKGADCGFAHSEAEVGTFSATATVTVFMPPSPGELQRMGRQCAAVIKGAWPRAIPRAYCRHHKAAEVGQSSVACSRGILCDFKHELKECREGAACQRKACVFVHPVDIDDILRLDTRLAALNGEGRSLVQLLAALRDHRKAMTWTAEELLAKRRERLLALEAEAEAEEEATEATDAGGAERRAAGREAKAAQLAELRKQLAEFEAAQMDFGQADPSSFHAARIFAREAYNRFAKCLPIYAERSQIMEALREDYSVLVLSAETGSGKSTQVVQYISEVVPGRVLCTQPRRLAANTLADRVAEEMQTLAPRKERTNLVASDTRSMNKRKPKIQFLTYRGLLNMLYYCHDLPDVSAVIVDEVHERSVAADVLVAVLRRCLSLRAKAGKRPFKLVLTSATMNESLFAKYFARKAWDEESPLDDSWAPTLQVGGRTFPVEVHYEASGSQKDYARAAEAKAIAVHKLLPATDLDARVNKDILVFLSQADEVERCARALREALPDCLCVPLHGGLDKEEQQEAFRPADKGRFRRKIVVATNVAETSVTIDGVGAVIDSGMAKQARYDPAKDATVLRVGLIAQSSAKQRAGRAGRTAPGECFRLYSEEEFADLEKDQPAELLRADATAAILMVLRQIQRQPEWIDNIREFPFVEHPGDARLEKALEMLHHFGALSSIDSPKLTEQGMAMAQMSVQPRVAAILFAAQRLRVLDLASVVLGMTQLTGFLFRRGRSDEQKASVLQHRSDFAQRFPGLGDVGAAAAVWLSSNKEVQLGRWCSEHSVGFHALKEGRGLVNSMLQEMQRSSLDAWLCPACQAQNGQSLVQCSGCGLDKAEAESADAGETARALESLTEESFRDEARLALLVQALLAGFFGNLAFYLPPRPSDEKALPTYYIPQNSQVGRTQPVAAFRLNTAYPKVILFMEIMDSGYISISNLCGVNEGFENQLPATYRESPRFQSFLQAARHRQQMSYPSVVKVDCPLALRRFAGPRGQKVAALQEELQEDFLEEGEVLVMEVDQRARMVLVMCSSDQKREEIASIVESQVSAIAVQLKQRRREWAIPGTGARAVVGTGGVCSEILLAAGQSISVVFNTTDAADRLSEPIKTLRQIPPGFFAELAASKLQDVTDLDAQWVIPTWTTYERQARQKNSRITDLREMPLASTVAAIEYTAGGLCYRCNPFLRECKEGQCRPFAPYLHALQNFVRRRSLHASNLGAQVVYRGCSIPLASAAEYVVGQSVIWPAFTSTSTSRQVAQQFAAATASSGSETFLFEITIPHACPVNDISVFPGEAEILLPAFSVMKVVGMHAFSRGMRMRLVELRYEPFAAHRLVAEGDQRSGEAAQAEEGPVIIQVKSRLKGEAGIAEELGRQLARFDAGVDADVRWDSEQHRVWGRASFRTTEAASRACGLLQGSIIGNRLITMRPAPVQTSGLALQCRVRVRLTGVPHRGMAIVDCGSREAVADIVGQQGEDFRVPVDLVLPGKGVGKVQAQPFRKGGNGKGQGAKRAKGKEPKGEVQPTLLHLSGIPGHVTQWQLQSALASKTRLFSDAVQPLKRDNQAMQAEAEALKKQGVAGTKSRQSFVLSLLPVQPDFVEETQIKFGAEYLLWFDSPETAEQASGHVEGLGERLCDRAEFFPKRPL